MTEYEKFTESSFHEKGKALFGENVEDWRWKCPMCGNIQGINDFRKYKEQGANPNNVYQECIGRWSGGVSAFSKKKQDKGKAKSPCDYASYGLFRIGHEVTFDNGNKSVIFPFAEKQK